MYCSESNEGSKRHKVRQGEDTEDGKSKLVKASYSCICRKLKSTRYFALLFLTYWLIGFLK